MDINSDAHGFVRSEEAIWWCPWWQRTAPPESAGFRTRASSNSILSQSSFWALQRVLLLAHRRAPHQCVMQRLGCLLQPNKHALFVLRRLSRSATVSEKLTTTIASDGSDAGVESDAASDGPLHGIKVLDVGQVVAGNFCGGLLAYFGADVIKIEPPGKGDALRLLRMCDSNGTSLWWRSYGRNRRCVTVDLRTEEGRKLLKRLSEHVDVLIENFRPGVMEKWGLGPKDLKSSLIYTRISGYGQTGPKAQLAGYASVCEAYGGFRHINGFEDRPPVRPNISLGDSLAGLHAAFGAVMALLHRQRQGLEGNGQVIDAAISESMFNMSEGCVPELVRFGYDRPPSGSTITGVVPSATFETREGRYVIIGGNGDSIYSRLMAACGRPDMGAENPEYATNAHRLAKEGEIYKVIGDWVGERSMEEVVAAMKEAVVPCGPILSTADIFREEQYRARNMFHVTRPPSEDGEEVTVPAMLPVMSRTPGGTKWAGPELGQHTQEVLREVLGMQDKEFQSLRSQGVV